MAELEPPDENPRPRVFATTHWSVVIAAGDGDPEKAKKALESLCLAYWHPIYTYVRRKGHSPEDAQDLTQEFFAQLITKDHVRLADRSKGKFRTFLLAMLDHFLAREWSRAHRQKRGGQFRFISLDQLSPEERFNLEPQDHETPEKGFLRQWAVTTLKHTMDALEEECKTEGKTALFDEVKPLLSGERDGAVYAGISKRLGIAEGTARVTVHRLRQRYGELLRDQIGRTVDGSQEVDEEMEFLMGVLRQ